jgi:hypothetical protein
MSTPDEAVQAQLAEQAQAVTGNPAAAGIYGDPAGASAAPQPIDLSQAAPTNVDTAALLARLEQLEAANAQAAADKAAAEEAAKPAPVEPDYNSLSVSGAVSAELHHVLDKIDRRFRALEGRDEAAEVSE